MIWHALSIRQPWAWAILHAGKDIENRDWKDWNLGLRFRGRFLIHASSYVDKKIDPRDMGSIVTAAIARGMPAADVPAYEALPRGGIVGMAELTGIATSHWSPWFTGPKGLVLANVKPLPFVECKGSLGFFEVLPAVVAQLKLSEAA
jgi:hypothetical protein